jgi:hypothetical protein
VSSRQVAKLSEFLETRLLCATSNSGKIYITSVIGDSKSVSVANIHRFRVGGNPEPMDGYIFL